jgi:N6-L-threonylcarbamoyladenine synthase
MAIPVLKKALGRIDLKKIDAVAVTAGPGLITSLLVGVETARALAFAWGKPLVAVNHLAGHISSNLLDSQFSIFNFQFPSIALVVSGGHTELVLMKNFGKYQIIGETLDDAVGEAFDKTAKILELGYPGGPAVSKLAEKGAPGRFKLPRPMLNSPDFNFSFSGLKTSVLYTVKVLKKIDEKIKADICREFEDAAAEVLVKKTVAAAKKYGAQNVFLAGGVAANKKLRESLGRAIHDKLTDVGYHIPEIKYTGDNAAMIAAAGYFGAAKKKFANLEKLDANPNWRIDERL